MAQALPCWEDMAMVGRIARPHGIRGQVIINPATDFLEERFHVGAVLHTKRGDRIEALKIESARFHRERPIVGFEGVSSMDAAAVLVNAELRVSADALQPLPAESFYRHDLIGCAVITSDGSLIGPVTGVEGSGAESRLVVSGADGEILVPLVDEICVEVDVATRRIVVKPPEGLLELNARSSKRGGRRGL